MQKCSTAKSTDNASLAGELAGCLADLEGISTEAAALVAAINIIMDGTHFPKETPAGIRRAWGAANMVSGEADKLAKQAENMTRHALRMAYDLRGNAPAAAPEGPASDGPAPEFDGMAEKLFAQSRALGLLSRALDSATLSDMDRDIYSFTLDGCIEAIDGVALMLDDMAPKGAAA